MEHIHAIIRLASRRIALTDFLRWLRDLLILALGVICIYLALERLAMVPQAPWFWWIPPVLIAAILVAVMLWSRHRLKQVNVAIAVDQQLGLDERLSSAMMLSDSDDPFARAAIDDAIRTARLPQTREQVGRAFKVRAPRGWWVPILLIALAVGIFFTPTIAAKQVDQTQQSEVLIVDSAEQAKEEVTASVSALEEAVAKDESLAIAMQETLDKMKPEALQVSEDASATEIRQDAIKKVTELNRRLEELLDSEQVQASEMLEEMLSKISADAEQSNATSELMKAMARGDFKAAQEAIKNLQEEIKQAGEGGQALAEEIADLAAQLNALSQQREQLAEALERAGLDGQLAENMAALEQALKQNQNLTQQQKDELRKLAESQMGACKQCNNMGQSMQQMAQACKQGGQQSTSKAGNEMSEQLSRMEMMQQMLQQAKVTQKMCVSECQSMGQCNGNQGQGGGGSGDSGAGSSGTGGSGQGNGGKNSVEETSVSMTEVKANIFTEQGDVIARELFDGEIEAGVSSASVKEVIRTAVEGFEDGVSEDPLPPYYDEVQKHYFGELAELIKALDAANQDNTSVDQPEPSQDEDSSNQ
ncbi:MAG: hypothetical protein P8J86_07675 [Phycisphaerales bacterium]|nr:hypothetical protein [Phycisphaerales bacterium]